MAERGSVCRNLTGLPVSEEKLATFRGQQKW